jgi:hypothetical protein
MKADALKWMTMIASQTSTSSFWEWAAAVSCMVSNEAFAAAVADTVAAAAPPTSNRTNTSVLSSQLRVSYRFLMTTSAVVRDRWQITPMPNVVAVVATFDTNYQSAACMVREKKKDLFEGAGRGAALASTRGPFSRKREEKKERVVEKKPIQADRRRFRSCEATRRRFILH